MKSHVLELSYECQSLIQFYQDKPLVRYRTSEGKCPYEQSKHFTANLPSFAPMQPLLKSVALSRPKRGLNLSHWPLFACYTFSLIYPLF